MNSGRIHRRTAVAGAFAAGLAFPALAQQGPVKIGMSMPLTGGLAAGGKSSLIGIEVWRDDVNAKGGLLGRKVELIVYDDKSSASETPAIYSKLLDVDKVDLLFAPYATVPTAPDHADGEAARPAADGQLLVPGEPHRQARQVVQQCAVGSGRLAGRAASSTSA